MSLFKSQRQKDNHSLKRFHDTRDLTSLLNFTSFLNYNFQPINIAHNCFSSNDMTSPHRKKRQISRNFLTSIYCVKSVRIRS